MSTIRLHLERAEYDAVSRYAEALGVTTEDIVYAALNRLMLTCENADVNRDIAETREWRRANLPVWSDSAGSVHAYEGKPDDEPERSKFV
ncbi:MAG TPA: hypothetical protein VHE61_22305 [Opitutaceae bacterium]|nr:hypothetical protein [Opitutaceae bacterium]